MLPVQDHVIDLNVKDKLVILLCRVTTYVQHWQWVVVYCLVYTLYDTKIKTVIRPQRCGTLIWTLLIFFSYNEVIFVGGFLRSWQSRNFYRGSLCIEFLLNNKRFWGQPFRYHKRKIVDMSFAIHIISVRHKKHRSSIGIECWNLNKSRNLSIYFFSKIL